MTTPITTTTQLEALPDKTVFRTRQDLLAELGTHPGGQRVLWQEGWCTLDDAIEYLAPLTVLHVPGQTPECDHAAVARALAQTTILTGASAEAIVKAAAQIFPAVTVKPGRDEVYAIVRDLVRDKGNVVYEWPDDEAAAYRDNHGFSEGWEAVWALRAEKGTRAILDILPGKTEQEVRAEALREAADEFESHVGVGEFEEQTVRDGIPWAHTAEAWEHQGPFMAWLRNRADEEAGK